MTRKNVRTVALLAIACLLLPLAASSVAGAAAQIDSGQDNAYADWSSENDWLIVSAVADVYGDNYMTTAGPYYTVRPGFAGSYSLGYDPNIRWGFLWLTAFWAASRYHKIECRELSSNLWPPELNRVYDNSQTSQLSGYIAAAFSWLQNLFQTFVVPYGFPFPDIWGLIMVDKPRYDVTSDSTGFIISYNYDPDAMGTQYFIQVKTPVSEGWYLVDLKNMAEAGTWMSSAFMSNGGQDQKPGHTPTALGKPYVVETLPGRHETTRAVHEGRPGMPEYSKTTVVGRPLNTLKSESETESLVFLPEENILIVLWADFFVDRTDI